MKKMFQILLVSVSLANTAYSSWKHEIIRSKDPVKIDLLKLYLNQHPEKLCDSDAEGKSLRDVALETGNFELAEFLKACFVQPKVQQNSNPLDALAPEIALPQEIWCMIVSLIDRPTLQDVASLRRVCKRVRDATEITMRGRLRYSIGSNSDLVRLLLLSNRPLLNVIGTLSIAYTENMLPQVFPSRFHVGLTFDETMNKMHAILLNLSKDHLGTSTSLLARAIVNYWPAFLRGNEALISSLRLIEFDPFCAKDYVLIKPLLDV